MQFRSLSETKFINDANLVSYWKLDEASGNATDSVGGKTLTANGTISYTSAKFNNGASATFNNTNYLSNSGLLASNLGTGDVSFSAWFKKNGAPTNNYAGIIMVLGTQANGKCYISADKTTGYFRFRTEDGSGATEATTTVNVCDNNWHYLTGTRVGTAVKAYIDGALITSTTGTARNINANNFQVGTVNSATEDNLGDALVDDMSVFTRGLGSAEVNDLYQGMTLGEYLPNSNTKLLLHLNGNSTDSSGNNNNGIDTAITYSQANGKFGMGAGFNGSSSKIGVAQASPGTETRTFSFWFKTTSNTGGSLSILDYTVADSNNDRLNIALTGDDSGAEQNKLICFTRGAAGESVYRYTGITVTDDVWRNFVCVLDNSANTINWYINGQLNQSAQTGSTLSSIDTTGTMYIGANLTGAGGFLTMELDELVIENYAWTPQQVAKYYANAKGYYATL